MQPRLRGILPRSMLSAIAEWLHKYALPLEVLLVILSTLVALYADTVRHFLSLPPGFKILLRPLQRGGIEVLDVIRVDSVKAGSAKEGKVGARE